MARLDATRRRRMRPVRALGRVRTARGPARWTACGAAASNLIASAGTHAPRISLGVSRPDLRRQGRGRGATGRPRLGPARLLSPMAAWGEGTRSLSATSSPRPRTTMPSAIFRRSRCSGRRLGDCRWSGRTPRPDSRQTRSAPTSDASPCGARRSRRRPSSPCNASTAADCGKQSGVTRRRSPIATMARAADSRSRSCDASRTRRTMKRSGIGRLLLVPFLLSCSLAACTHCPAAAGSPGTCEPWP